MQSRRGASDEEEETPSLLWGLDPVFMAFAKLYIKDILEIKESKKVAGMFFYNGHPIKQVDILGIVVHARERENFYSYGVDDSTGVINCTCWKKMERLEKSPLAAARSHQSAVGGLHLVEELKKLQDLDCQNTKVEIGDVIRVRGYIKVFREQREIVASVYHRVDDPVYDVQISRMLHLPYLYGSVYDQPLQTLQTNDADLQTIPSLTYLLSEKVEEFLTKNNVQNFYPRELETVDSLVSLTSGRTFNAQEEMKHASFAVLVNTPLPPGKYLDSASCPTAKQVRSLFKDAIGLLQERGVVFLKLQNQDVYHITDQDKQLRKMTLGIIQADCKRHRHADKGCHFLHILTCVRQSYSSSVTEAVLQRVLDELEGNSQIVSTMEKYYTTF